MMRRSAVIATGLATAWFGMDRFVVLCRRKDEGEKDEGERVWIKSIGSGRSRSDRETDEKVSRAKEAVANFDKKNDDDEVFDVAIVGAGVVGLAVARFCAWKGLTVGCFEREDVVSAAASSVIRAGCTGYDAPRIVGTTTSSEVFNYILLCIVLSDLAMSMFVNVDLSLWRGHRGFEKLPRFLRKIVMLGMRRQ